MPFFPLSQNSVMYAVLLPAFTAIFPSEHRPAALPHCQASQRPTWYLDIFLNAIIAFIFPKSTLCRNPPALYCSNPLEGLSSNLRKKRIPMRLSAHFSSSNRGFPAKTARKTPRVSCRSEKPVTVQAHLILGAPFVHCCRGGP